jgi:hypothetical protein
MLLIKIIGIDDQKQKKLVAHTQNALTELGITARIYAVTAIDEILRYDLIQTPALVIRNQVLSQGFVPEIPQIKQVIRAFLPDEVILNNA